MSKNTDLKTNPDLESGVGILAPEEAETLGLMLGYGMPEGFRQADFDAVLNWAEETRMNAGILENVLSASMAVCVVKGDVQFKTTAKGDREVEQMTDRSLGAEGMAL